MDAGVGAEPRLLPSDEAAGPQGGVGDRLVDRRRAVDDRQRLRVADRPARGPPLPQAEVDQRARLVDEPGVEHRAGPALDALVEELAVEPEPDDDGRADELAGRHRRAERTTGEGDDLEGAHDAAAVVRLDGSGGPWVDRAQLGEEGRDALRRQPPLEGAPDLGVGRRDLEAVEGGPHVEPGPTRDDRERATTQDVLDVAPRLSLVGGDARLLGDVEDVDLVVRDAVALPDRHLGGPDVHAPVELRRVGADDLAAEPLGERDGEVGLAGRRRPDDTDDEGHVSRCARPRGCRRRGRTGRGPPPASTCGPASPSRWP